MCLAQSNCHINQLCRACAMAASLYDILCVEPSASQLELKAAYKRRVLEVHPDKGGSVEVGSAVVASLSAGYSLPRPSRTLYTEKRWSEVIQELLHPPKPRVLVKNRSLQ